MTSHNYYKFEISLNQEKGEKTKTQKEEGFALVDSSATQKARIAAKTTKRVTKRNNKKNEKIEKKCLKITRKRTLYTTQMQHCL